ncbi:MAG: hypothetical protein K0S65_3181 [Labilithrix sp.]|nr:hypothetical protein [Labilithrix sp.]
MSRTLRAWPASPAPSERSILSAVIGVRSKEMSLAGLRSNAAEEIRPGPSIQGNTRHPTPTSSSAVSNGTPNDTRSFNSSTTWYTNPGEVGDQRAATAT